MSVGFADTLLPCSSVVDILVDSGAFSEYADRLKAAKHGTEITKAVTIEEYIDFCKTRLDGVVWQYIMLDRINDHPGTIANLRAMADAGLKPMPVLVGTNSTCQDLDEMLQVNERISVGGGVSTHLKFIAKRYQNLFRASHGKAKIHALGFCRLPATFVLPLSTCDSSTFCSSGQYGKVMAYRNGRMENMPYRQLEDITNPRAVWFRSHLKEQGINLEAEIASLKGKQNNVFNMLTGSSILAFIQLSQQLLLLDIRYFFAVPNVWWFMAVAAVFATFDGQRFDFNTSRELFTEWNGLVKAKSYAQASNRVIDALKGKEL